MRLALRSDFAKVQKRYTLSQKGRSQADSRLTAGSPRVEYNKLILPHENSPEAHSDIVNAPDEINASR